MNKNIFFISVLLLFGVTVFFSCKKDTPPKAIVTVVDTGGVRIANVKVTVYAKPNGSYVDPDSKSVNAIEFTDSGGDAYFTFKYKAILYAKAELFNGSNPTPIKSGEKIIKLEENKTQAVTVTIK